MGDRRVIGAMHLVEILLALCGLAVLLFATAHSIGLSPDSCAYIGAARGLLQGLGLGTPVPEGHYSPMVFYAPLFPFLLAGVGLLGIDPLEGARWLNGVLFAGNIFLTGTIVGRATGSAFYAWVASILLLISFPMLEVHSMAWSEPTFVFFSLLALLWLSRYAERGGTGNVIAAAIAVGFGVLSRHAGLALIGIGIAALVISARRPYRHVVRDCVLFALLSGFICGVSFARNWIVTGTLTNRPGALQFAGLAPLRGGLRTILRWIWLDAGPRRLPLAVIGVGATALLLHGLAQWLPPTRARTPRGMTSAVTRTALLFVAGYVCFVLVTISFVDASIPFDDRILSPLFVWALIGAVCGAQRLVAHPRWRYWGQPLMVLAGMWFAVAQLLHLVPWMIDVHRNGQGYATPAWRDSEIMAQIRALPGATRIFSNGDDAIYLLTGRLAERVPERPSATEGRQDEGHEVELARMRRRLSESTGVIVYFSRIDWRPDLVSPADLQSRMRLRTLYAAADGTMYGVED